MIDIMDAAGKYFRTKWNMQDERLNPLADNPQLETFLAGAAIGALGVRMSQEEIFQTIKAATCLVDHEKLARLLDASENLRHYQISGDYWKEFLAALEDVKAALPE